MTWNGYDNDHEYFPDNVEHWIGSGAEGWLTRTRTARLAGRPRNVRTSWLNITIVVHTKKNFIRNPRQVVLKISNTRTIQGIQSIHIELDTSHSGFHKHSKLFRSSGATATVRPATSIHPRVRQIPSAAAPWRRPWNRRRLATPREAQQQAIAR